LWFIINCNIKLNLNLFLISLIWAVGTLDYLTRGLHVFWHFQFARRVLLSNEVRGFGLPKWFNFFKSFISVFKSESILFVDGCDLHPAVEISPYLAFSYLFNFLNCYFTLQELLKYNTLLSIPKIEAAKHTKFSVKYSLPTVAVNDFK
jgi:hypothetical protein